MYQIETSKRITKIYSISEEPIELKKEKQQQTHQGQNFAE
jgi:hypothetical protein